MLPIITEDISGEVFEEVFKDVQSWRKNMIQYLKDENPEVNSAILEVAKQDENIDLKAVALGGYIVYRMLEVANNDNAVELDL